MDKQFQLLSNQLNDSDHIHSEREDQLQEYAESSNTQLARFEKATENAAKALEQRLNNDNDSLNGLLTERFDDLTAKLNQLDNSLSHRKNGRESYAGCNRLLA